MKHREAHAIFLHCQQHPQPIPVSGRLIQGVGWGFLLVAPFWLVVGVVMVRGALGA